MNDITYHLGPGITVSVEGVDDKQIDIMAKCLRHTDGLIEVSSNSTNKTQYIPVRSISFVDVTKVK